ncbi:MAG TPA: elongation factor 1-beta [Thermoplasmatales archaeon]|nr:MAG: elongation factor 1-beta [Thermoplasmata archaeon]RLF47463.1 MAG: elongation factor 1-beta [Thermoplasmata archaeon]HDH81584.1 elongation factor 1-beta [Thermoplasmatales archaeon]
MNVPNAGLWGRDKMGEVSLTIRVMPDDAGMDMNKLKDDVISVLPDYAKLVNTEEQPIAFGLKALLIKVIMPDQSPDELIEKISTIEHVENAEIQDLSLL